MKLMKSARWRRLVGVLAAILVLVLCSNAAVAQKNKKGKSKSDQQQDDANVVPVVLGSDADQIDHDIGEMLAAFQIGNVEMMHKYYADNVTFVSGGYEPPVVGWQNYVPLYQRQIASFQSMQIIRRNTIVFPHGDVAWAMYQWEFSSLYDGKPYAVRGQTTLIFNKIGANWLIVHNHTSEVLPETVQAQPPAATQQAPAPAKH